jgi:signal transduction histidine kinase
MIDWQVMCDGESSMPDPGSPTQPEPPRPARTPGSPTASGPEVDWLLVLSRLVGNFAHQARNPLAALAALFHVWPTQGREAPAEWAERGRRQVERLEAMVADVLALEPPARSESEALPADEIARRAVERVRQLSVPGWEDLILAPAAGPLGDSAEGADRAGSANRALCGSGGEAAVRALAELLRNALEIPADAPWTGGGPRAHLSIGRGEGEIRFEVRDVGPGLTSQELRSSFEPFTSTKRGRPGLGLTVAEALARRSGGRIEARSQVGLGSVFTLVLPAETR